MKASDVNAVATGCLTFDAFAQRTSVEWDRMAHKIVRRFPTLGWSTDDVRQELLTAAWVAIVRHGNESDRTDLAAFVATCARNATLRHIHRARGAARCRGAAESRAPLLASDCLPDSPDDGPGPDTLTEYREALSVATRRLSGHRSGARYVVALRALVRAGSIDGAAVLLFRSKRVPFRLENVQAARRLVQRAARHAVGRVV